MKEYSFIGKRTPKVDSRAKASGEARFATDIYLKGMLHGKVLRSIYPHARILRIDTEKAKRLPGVKAVITAEDVPAVKYGNWIVDMEIFARWKVRYIGEPVAAVAAIDEDTALNALDLMNVEYEEFTAVFDPLEAMLGGVTILHEDLKNYVTHFYRTERSMTGNVNYHGMIEQGDIGKGFADSDLVFEDTFRTPKVHQSYLEPHTSVASFDHEGRVTVWTSTQRPHLNQTIIGSLLGLKATKVRVIPCSVGAGFGGKNRTLSEPIAVALAQKAKAPVRLSFTREEEFSSTTTRHSAIIKMKTGVKRDGTLVASQVDLIFDTGAYAQTINAAWLGALTGFGPYRIPNVKVDVFGVYTNKTMGGAFRGYGTPQVAFARESQMDEIARAVKIDPVEIRLRNCFKKGDVQPTGHPLASVNVEKTILQAAEKIGWKEAGDEHRAFGISCGFTPCGGFATACMVRVNQDGSVIASTGAMDMGQGLNTVLSQIIAEELGVPIEDVLVICGDTDCTPFDVGIFEDRGTHTVGMSAKMAAADAKSQIFDLAAEEIEVNREALFLEDGKICVKGSPDPLISLKDLIRGSGFRKGKPIIGRASINPDTPPTDLKNVRGATSRLPSTYTFATNTVEIKVDPLTGQVNVIRAVGAHDCGTVINPDGAEGQIEGGMATALGYGLLEEVLIKDGQVLNPNFLEYKIPTALDMPALSRVIVESYDELGPFGAKGVGNSPVINMAPAIANAVARAVGVRIKELPITAESILKGLEEKGD